MLIGVAMATLILVSGDGWAEGTSYVAVGGGHIEPYDNWERAANSLHAAVNLAAASNWTTVLVSNGTYYLSNEVTIAQAMTVRSWNNGGLDSTGTVLDCNNYAGKSVTNRAFYLNHDSAIVEGFTITNGALPLVATLHGGAVFIRRGIVQNCIIRQNTAWGGGGIAIGGWNIGLQPGTGSVINCTIHSNRCPTPSNVGGGGISAWTDSRAFISNCLVSENTARWTGGGVRIAGQSEVINCVISNNSSTDSSGGGLYVIAGNAEFVLSNSTIIGNSALNGNDGGGVRVGTGSGRIENCRILDNYARDGGGVYLGTSTGRLVNCLIAGNTATRNYGGIHGSSTNPNCSLINCVIAHNSATAVGGLSLQNGTGVNTIIYGNTGGASSNYNVSAADTYFSHCCAGMQAVPLPGDNNLNSDPLFKVAGIDFRLSASSPCLDAGTNQEWMASGVDLDGLRRVDRFRGRVDIGAYEHVPQGMLFLLR